MRSGHLTAMSFALLMAMSAPSYAEPQGSGRGWGMPHMQGWGMGMRGHDQDWMLGRVEGRLAFMKAELKITDAQAGPWNAFADSVRTAAKLHNHRMQGMFSGDDQSKPLPDRIEQNEQFMSARLDQIKLIKASLKSLYAVLTDEQKQEANDMMIPMVGMGGRWN